MRGEGQRLSAQLLAAFDEIEQLKTVYRRAIEQLETFALPDLSALSAAQWFRLVRGPNTDKAKIDRYVKADCLSIDDGNAIFQRMEGRKLVKESRMDTWFMTMDRLDRDDVGLLDKQLSRCLERFLGLRSAFYGRLELNGEDPHQRLLVFGGSGGSATQQALLLEKVSRECFGPKQCSCLEDAEPWEGFSLKPGDALAHKVANGAARAAGASESDDVGILAIKRQWGFEDLTHDKGTEADDAALTREAAELTKRRKARGQRGTFGGGARPTATARSIYQKKVLPFV
ncbi:hypothetical protein BBJ28_00023091 [Nothophytophthora sp. Chile5]|nr:hypothetical protein BBJ28_00023091 [Nothophytophthora sp. Chile5]